MRLEATNKNIRGGLFMPPTSQVGLRCPEEGFLKTFQIIKETCFLGQSNIGGGGGGGGNRVKIFFTNAYFLIKILISIKIIF